MENILNANQNAGFKTQSSIISSGSRRKPPTAFETTRKVTHFQEGEETIHEETEKVGSTIRHHARSGSQQNSLNII